MEWERIAKTLDAAKRSSVRRRLREGDPRTCPFLDLDCGECSIYEVRPLACRTYGYYVHRGAGLWCSDIEHAVNEEGLAENVIFGNAEAIEDQLGELQPLSKWLED